MIKMNFEKYKFKTGEIYLPELDFSMRLDRGQYFRNDGIVPDLLEHALKIQQSLSVSYAPKINAAANGCFLGITDDPEEGFYPGNVPDCENGAVIFIRDTAPFENIITTGHEVTHALAFFGQEHTIAALLEEEGFKPERYTRIEDDEAKAEIGGYILAHRRNKRQAGNGTDYYLELIDYIMLNPDLMKQVIKS